MSSVCYAFHSGNRTDSNKNLKQSIRGVRINDIKFKISLIAKKLCIHDLDFLVRAIAAFNKFEKCSDLTLNLGKTEIVPIGRKKTKWYNLPKHINKIKINNVPFKALRIWFTRNSQELIEINFSN